MDSNAVVAALAVSLLHASWHAIINSTGDRIVSLAGMNGVSAATILALLPLTKPLSATAFWIIAGSVILHFSSVLTWALSRTPVGAVSALRETSVLFAALIAAVVLGERAGWIRYAPAAAVTLGVGIIALAR